jgi:hypothetical protein
LLDSVTSADITEMLAYSELEPWGPLQADFRAGQICATLANVNRDPRARAEAWAARDFFPSLDRAMSSIPRASAAVLLDDPQAQSDLIKQAIFGVQP